MKLNLIQKLTFYKPMTVTNNDSLVVSYNPYNFEIKNVNLNGKDIPFKVENETRN